MAKIILSKGDTVLQEMRLSKDRVTIGRRPHNDIVIDNLAISAEHAVIVTSNHDSFLEDLNSTNGTQVNGQPVRKHFLQDRDVIELAQYTIEYCVNDATGCGDQKNSEGLVLRHECDDMTHLAAERPIGLHSTALIHVLSGPHAGKSISLTNVLTTLGLPGVQVAVVTQRSRDYYLSHVDGDGCIKINGQSVGPDCYRMLHGDVIELLGIQMKFVRN